jgi:transcriptional regulator with XRE-family HTH domain
MIQICELSELENPEGAEEDRNMNPLRRERILQGKSIHLVAHRTGIDSAKISLIERELKIPTPEERRKLARVLRARVKDLFPPKHHSRQGTLKVEGGRRRHAS